MNRLLNNLLLLNFRQYRERRIKKDVFLSKFQHDSFVRLNPEE